MLLNASWNNFLWFSNTPNIGVRERLEPSKSRCWCLEEYIFWDNETFVCRFFSKCGEGFFFFGCFCESPRLIIHERQVCPLNKWMNSFSTVTLYPHNFPGVPCVFFPSAFFGLNSWFCSYHCFCTTGEVRWWEQTENGEFTGSFLCCQEPDLLIFEFKQNFICLFYASGS